MISLFSHAMIFNEISHVTMITLQSITPKRWTAHHSELGIFTDISNFLKSGKKKLIVANIYK